MTDKAIEAAHIAGLNSVLRVAGFHNDQKDKLFERYLPAAIQAYLAESVGDYGELVKAGREKKLNINAANQGLLLDAIERLVAERDIYKDQADECLKGNKELSGELEAAEARAKDWESNFHKSESIGDDTQLRLEAVEADKRALTKQVMEQQLRLAEFEGYKAHLQGRADAAEDTANACRVDWADIKQHLGAALDDALDRFIESTELAQQERADVLAARVAELESEIDCCCNAVNDALSVSGSDFVRVRACMKRLRANLEDKE